MTRFQPAIGTHDLERLAVKCQKQLNLEALAYLESRDIHEKTIASFGLGYEHYKIGFAVEQATVHLAGRIVFPIRDREGVLQDLIGRLLDDREPKYKSLLGTGPLLFNAPVLQEADEVVLAGGMFTDADRGAEKPHWRHRKTAAVLRQPSHTFQIGV